jgi:hypothetical protein
VSLKKDGFDSVFAKGGADLRNNEFIVYNGAQCTVSHLIEIGIIMGITSIIMVYFMILLVVGLTYQKDNKMEEKQDMIGVKMPN